MILFYFILFTRRGPSPGLSKWVPYYFLLFFRLFFLPGVGHPLDYIKMGALLFKKIKCTDLESCQLFYYCVHMAEKTTPLCYVSFYVRCSVLHLGYVSFYVRCSVLDLLTRGSRVLCTCTADIVLHAVQSVFGCACARNFLLWNCFLHELFRIFRVLAYFASALLRPLFTEYYSMTGELTSSL